MDKTRENIKEGEVGWEETVWFTGFKQGPGIG